VSELLDGIDGLLSHADGYPEWARLLFFATFVLAVVSCVVYAAEVVRLRRRPAGEETPEAPPVAPRG
jgi:hypothetical protein